jgi:uncharacterized protein (DUF983 family)
MARSSLGTLLWRGLRRRCPRCGARGIFRGWFTLRDRCPSCRLEFAHEEGYWVGALIMNTAFAIAAFAATFALGLILTWPDVPWAWLTVICVAVNIVVPIVSYPYSKTIWMAVDGVMNPWHLDPDPPPAEGA